MKNTIKVFGIIALVAVIVITDVSCSGSGGVKSFKSAEALKKYLDKQPANSADKPIKIAMMLNESMFEKVKNVIAYTDKYVSFDFTGSPTTTIPIGAFSLCERLKEITIPDSVTSIGDKAFHGCKSLSSINIPDGVTSIGDYTFSNCSSLTSIKIPDNVTSIGEYAFSNCTSLTSVKIPDNVTSIGEYAFSNCTSLTSVKIPDSVTSINFMVFESCKGLTSVIIGKGVNSIENFAFQNCASLNSITIPKNVVRIGEGAFGACTSLSNVTFEGKFSFYDSNASNLIGMSWPTFLGDLDGIYYYGGIGTYTTTAPVDHYSEWTKQK